VRKRSNVNDVTIWAGTGQRTRTPCYRWPLSCFRPRPAGPKSGTAARRRYGQSHRPLHRPRSDR
jgi:hypothetical protein